ncbi:MAG: hypothetical protein A2W33_03895 [Chloroflexi bacterium RBG_16_52_11]|nr:MAG: hypothetical protein A2W33_03895 [Chloroflexi bacterium RBG_16_52_11]
MRPRKIIWAIIASVILLACSITDNLPLPASKPAPAAPATLTPIPPSPTPTLTPTPLPTPIPAVRVEIGDQSRFKGDWDGSLSEYQTALDSSPDPLVQSAALLGIGRTRYLAADYEGSIQILQQLIQTYPQSPHLPYAHFYLGQAYSALGLHSEASGAYQNYLNLRPGLVDAYILNLRADELVAAGDHVSAVHDYRAAVQAPSLLNGLLIEIKIANSHASLGDYDTALGMYQDIYYRAQTDFTKAQMDYLMGQAYAATGRLEEAYAAYQDAVINFPNTNSAYLSLLELVDAEVPVDDLYRGIVDYYAGQYGVGMAAFDRYFQAGGPEQDKARYFNGLTLRALGGNEGAIGEWERIIQNFTESAYWDKAWEQKAITQWQFMNDGGSGYQTLLDFVATAPNHPRAAELLYQAGEIAELDGRLTEAADTWKRVAADYPSFENAQRALLLAGITHYRLNDFANALAAFQKYLENSTTLEERASAHFWQGKAYSAMGDLPAATSAWEMAASIDPTGYYSERANDILRQRSPFTPPENFDLSYELTSERLQAEEWLRTRFSLPAATDLSSSTPLMSDSRFTRGNELWELGLYEEARSEFEELRQGVQSDPANSYRLANHLLELGFYRSAILSARQVLNLVGMSDLETLNAPAYFNHVRFGTYFADLILSAAQQADFHPLMVFSIIRQESAFESFASSSADARGLMQIVPATGSELATELDWPANYSDSDLYRPMVSLVYGTHYLAKWRDYFGGDMYAALAAYNGGPGNAIEWKKLAPDDPDLLLEVIRFDETRAYIRGIYEIFNIYRRIYDRTP